jgi:hypothetical protein
MNWSELILRWSPWLLRALIVFIATLGTVYFFGRLIFPSLNKKTAHANKIKNRIAAFSLCFFSFASNLVYDYPTLLTAGIDSILWWRYILDSVIMVGAGAILFVTVGWRFYPRVDTFLDKKFAKDQKEKKDANH